MFESLKSINADNIVSGIIGGITVTIIIAIWPRIRFWCRNQFRILVNLPPFFLSGGGELSANMASSIFCAKIANFKLKVIDVDSIAILESFDQIHNHWAEDKEYRLSADKSKVEVFEDVVSSQRRIRCLSGKIRYSFDVASLARTFFAAVHNVSLSND